MHRNTAQGFTIVELLVVLSIIGTIVSAGLASVTITRAKGRDIRRISDAKQIVTALSLHWTTSAQMPCSNTTTSASPDFLQEFVTLGYLPQAPRDPLGGSYVYEYFSFRNPSIGTCGSGGGYVGFYTENDMTECPAGGKLVAPRHCHIFFPGPIACSNPWNNPMLADCVALKP